MAHVHSDACENCTPLDELDFAEELSDVLSDPTFPPLSNADMNDYVDTLAGLYATEEDDNEED